MKQRRLLVFHFERIRRLVRKFILVILFMVAFFFMIFDKTENVVIEKTSTIANDAVGPLMDVFLLPARGISATYDYFRELKAIHKDNEKLREENKILLQMRDKARALEIENKILSNLLNYTPPPEVKFYTARVIAEEGDAFSHSLIIYTGNNKGLKKGQVVLSENGVVGRIESVGRYYARVITIADINSKIPVIIERTRMRAILAGDNTSAPKLTFLPLIAEIETGDRIITSGIAGTFPAGLPIGIIKSTERGNIRITPFSDFDKLEYVRIVDYNLEESVLNGE